MTQTHLFRFTPSMMPPETLEQLLVQRQALAQRLSDLIRESVTTQSKHHKLLIGPRGMGKTHLVALTYYRVKAMDDLRENLWIAWLNEEEWGVDSFLDLLLRICRALQAEYPTLFPSARVEALYQITQSEAQYAAELLLKEFIGNRTLVLLMENLDELFKGIGDKGQRQFRSFLQETAFTTILATSQGLFNGVSRYNSPFYGFFSVTHLQEFSVEDATLLLKNIAEWKQDKALVDFIETPAGRARVRTVNHLAGGNPRVYVIFSEFLTRESLDELVEPFLKTLDELTPYYQARISALSMQQRKMVEFLCDHAAPATVKEIAKRCFMSQQTASSQLKDLKEKGYVLPDPLGPTGRDTYYELKEPLMRLCLEVKKSRSGPIRLLIDFLRLWYPISELKQQLELCSPEAHVERNYLLHAIRAAEETDDPRVKECRQTFDQYMEAEKFEQALTITEELVAIEHNTNAYMLQGTVLLRLERFEEALISYNTALDLDSSNASAWNGKGVVLLTFEQNEEAASSFEQAVELLPTNEGFWQNLAFAYEQLEQFDKFFQTLERAIYFFPASADLWIRYGDALDYQNRFEVALNAYVKAAKLNPHSEMAWMKQSFVLGRFNRHKEAVQCLNKAIQHNPRNGRLWYNKGQALAISKQYEQALNCMNKSVEYDPESDCAYYDLAWAVIGAQSFEAGMKCLEEAFQSHPLNEKHLSRHTWFILRMLLENAQVTQWSAQMSAIVDLYARYHLEKAIPPSLILTLSNIFDASIACAVAEKWYESWKVAAGSRFGFDLPLRLMDTLIRYKATQDRRILLELPAEERKILEPLLQVTEKQNDDQNEHFE